MTPERQVETLQLDEDTRTEFQVKIDRARIEGFHEGIKEVISQIEKIEQNNILSAKATSIDFIRLKNELGILVYKNWPKKE